MKLQRYTPEIDKITSDHCRAAMVETYAEGGYWVRDDDIESLETENAALHAEYDRLTAMLGPQRVLSAEEVAEGFYWQRDDDNCEWGVNYVCSEVGHMLQAGVVERLDIFGQFKGPIKMPPEVRYGI